MDLPNPGIKLGSPVLQADSLPTELLGKPVYILGFAYQFLEKKKKLSAILIGIALTILSVTDQLEKNCHLKTSSLPNYEHVMSVYFIFFAILHTFLYFNHEFMLMP